MLSELIYLFILTENSKRLSGLCILNLKFPLKHIPMSGLFERIGKYFLDLLIVFCFRFSEFFIYEF